MTDRIVGSASVGITPDAQGFIEKLRAAIVPGTDQVGDEIGKNIGQHMRDRLDESLALIDAKLAELGAKDINIRVRVDDNGSLARTDAEITAVDRTAANAGGSNGGMGLFSSRIANIGIAAISAADIAIPAILAIGAAAGGLIAGAGVFALGTQGVGAALQAANTPSPGGGAPVAGAQLGQQSAQLAANQATQQAQDAVISATQAHTDAVVALAKAQRDAKQAQVDLTLARIAAKQAMQDLDNSVKDNALAQQQAAIKLAEAKRTLDVTLAAPGASLAQYAQQVAQAKLDYALAQQKVSELALTGQRLAAQDKTSHSQGVEGSPGVIAAKNKVTDTTTAQAKAQATLIDSSHKLVEAQANIASTAQKNAIALAQAALAMQSAAYGANSFAQAMAKLNPLQQQFVEFLLSLKPLFEELKLAAAGFLPGLEKGIKDALPTFQPLLGIVSNVAAAMGTVFQSIGQSLASQDGQKFLTFLSTELPKQIQFLGTLFIDFGKIFGHIWETAGPLIDAFDHAFTSFLDKIVNSTAGKSLASFFDSLGPILPPLFNALSAIGGLLGSILVATAPAMTPLLNFLTVLAQQLASLATPVLKPLAIAFGDLLNAVAPLLPALGDLIKTILPPLITLIDALITSGIAPLVTAIAKDLAPQMGPLSKAFTDLVNAIIPLIKPLVDQIIPRLPDMISGFAGILIQGLKLAPLFLQMAGPLTTVAGPFLDLVNALLKLVNTLMPAFGPLLTGLVPFITPLVRALAPLLESLAKIVDFLTTIGKFLSGGSGSPNSYSPPNVTAPNGSSHAYGGTPHKAIGGAIFAGQAYKVGEVGPELFVPKVDGTIVNNAQLTHMARQNTNGQGKTNYFAVYGQSDPNATAHAVANKFAARGI